MNIRLGLIGCGEHSEIGHAIPLARYAATHAEAITLTAACDLRQERAELLRGHFLVLKLLSISVVVSGLGARRLPTF
jgi:predicted dehydrogenase